MKLRKKKGIGLYNIKGGQFIFLAIARYGQVILTIESNRIKPYKISLPSLTLTKGLEAHYLIKKMEEIIEFVCYQCEVWRWYCAYAGDPQGESPPLSFWSCDCEESVVCLK